MSEPDSIVIAPGVVADLPAVVELCMMVEAQHEAYWPLRWKTKPGIREGYLRWMTRNIDSADMLIAVARAGAGDVVPEVPAVRFDAEAAGLFEAGAPNPTRVAGAIIVGVQDEIPIYTYRQFAFVHDLAVAPNYRRRGVARRLLEAARAWSASRGMGQLRLMVADKNLEARAAFDRAGFVPTYQEMVLPVEREKEHGE